MLSLTCIYVPTWVICIKANGNPTTSRNTNRVPLNRVNQIKICRVFVGVIVSKTLSNNKEVIAMKMQRVALSTKNTSILQHQLHTGIELQHNQLCVIANHCVVWWCPCVIERDQRGSRETSLVYLFRRQSIMSYSLAKIKNV